MRASIVIPTKNEESALPELLTSLRTQSFKDYEIIVADAQSTDQTRDIASAFGARVIEGGMPGPGRNRGADVAQGEMLIFLDADVRLPDTDFLEANLNEMRQRELDMAAGPLMPSDGIALDRAMYAMYDRFIVLTEGVLPHAAGSCFFIKRDVHQKLGGFDETVVFAEDHEYARRLQKAGYRFGVLRSRLALVSIRRSIKEGRAKLAAKYAWTELRMMTRGAYRGRMPFSYEFGQFNLPKSKTSKKEE